MRINRFIALATGLSRRASDSSIAAARVTVNGQTATAGQTIENSDVVTLDGKLLRLPESTTTIMFNKPVGYVSSRKGQGSKTIYDLLPKQYRQLKPVGRLDKDSSGLLLLTDDGKLAQLMSHPKYGKEKVYEISLDKPLTKKDAEQIRSGVELEDGPSKLEISGQANAWTVRMREGRNRQIRRTFEALGYEVTSLHRIKFGQLELAGLGVGKYKEIL